jgi:hypothetical protein
MGTLREALAPALRTDDSLVIAGLGTGVVRFDECPLQTDKQRLAVLVALREYPDLQAPASLLGVLAQGDLWSCGFNHSVATYLIEVLQSESALRPDLANLPALLQDFRGNPPPMTPALQHAVADLLRQGQYPIRLAVEMMQQDWLTDPLAAKTLYLALREHRETRRSAAGLQAAATRRRRAATPPATPADPEPPRRLPLDQLRWALQQGFGGMVEPVPIELIPFTDVEPLLPIWLASDPRVQAQLLRVPDLPAPIATQALNGWASETDFPRTSILPAPVAPAVLTTVTPRTAAVLLYWHLQAWLQDFQRDPHPRARTPFRPLPQDTDIQGALLRIALEDPHSAAELTGLWTTAQTLDRIHALAQAPRSPSPTSPEIRWVAEYLAPRSDRSPAAGRLPHAPPGGPSRAGPPPCPTRLHRDPARPHLPLGPACTLSPCPALSCSSPVASSRLACSPTLDDRSYPDKEPPCRSNPTPGSPTWPRPTG